MKNLENKFRQKLETFLVERLAGIFEKDMYEKFEVSLKNIYKIVNFSKMVNPEWIIPELKTEYNFIIYKKSFEKISIHDEIEFRKGFEATKFIAIMRSVFPVRALLL